MNCVDKNFLKCVHFMRKFLCVCAFEMRFPFVCVYVLDNDVFVCAHLARKFVLFLLFLLLYIM